MWKEVVIQFQVLSWDLPGVTEYNYEKNFEKVACW
jgi:hypothetical protein